MKNGKLKLSQTKLNLNQTNPNPKPNPNSILKEKKFMKNLTKTLLIFISIFVIINCSDNVNPVTSNQKSHDNNINDSIRLIEDKQNKDLIFSVYKISNINHFGVNEVIMSYTKSTDIYNIFNFNLVFKTEYNGDEIIFNVNLDNEKLYLNKRIFIKEFDSDYSTGYGSVRRIGNVNDRFIKEIKGYIEFIEVTDDYIFGYINIIDISTDEEKQHFPYIWEISGHFIKYF